MKRDAVIVIVVYCYGCRWAWALSLWDLFVQVSCLFLDFFGFLLVGQARPLDVRPKKLNAANTGCPCHGESKEKSKVTVSSKQQSHSKQ